jgi:aminoglycoside phosphotransferase (APT) family kinase protein
MRHWPKPACRSYNLAYFITFSAGCRMVARLPGNGANFRELERKKMDHEYHIMQLLKARISIPIPEVFTWRTEGSDIGVPFALISFTPARSICDLWFDADWATEARRLKTLDQIAMHMSQLHLLEFKGEMGTHSLTMEAILLVLVPATTTCPASSLKCHGM